ncbi:MAG: hypothetical protein KJ737_09075 [Proteobacteria bacterium]|nr:hypothetical protein [Pseudomonadota bacterium]
MERRKLTRYAVNCLFILLVSTVFVIGCGGGSSSDSDKSKMKTGVFVDDPVEGLTYVTDSTSGTTDQEGTFEYVIGESIAFYIGDVYLGTAEGDDVITPVDLVPDATGVEDPTVTNISVLLQTLDADMDPSNGISIDESMLAYFNELNIDFFQSVDEFMADPDVHSLLDQINIMEAVSGDTLRELVLPEQAQANLAASLAEIAETEVDGTAVADDTAAVDDTASSDSTDDTGTTNSESSLPESLTIQDILSDLGSLLSQFHYSCITDCNFDSDCITACYEELYPEEGVNTVSILLYNEGEEPITYTVPEGTTFYPVVDGSTDITTDTGTSTDTITDTTDTDTGTGTDTTTDTTETGAASDEDGVLVLAQEETLAVEPGLNLFILPAYYLVEPPADDAATDDAVTDDTTTDDTATDDTTTDDTATDDTTTDDSIDIDITIDDTTTDEPVTYTIGNPLVSSCMAEIFSVIKGAAITAESYEIIQELIWKCNNPGLTISESDWDSLYAVVEEPAADDTATDDATIDDTATDESTGDVTTTDDGTSGTGDDAATDDTTGTDTETTDTTGDTTTDTAVE